MLNTEKTISNFIEQQFPFFMQQEGPLFIEFVKQYYVWMETQSTGAIYNARRMPEYKDIDTTVDSFLVYFKEKYLKNIQFNTAASLKRMVKHSLDLYRSKGTPRAIDLLFKVVFDTPAQVYLPGTDIFKLSSGDFYEEKYLEVIPSPYNITFVGKEIIGLQSGATAFVEKLSRKKVKNTFVEVFTISALKNQSHFLTGEIIKGVTQGGSVVNNPVIIGSLTNVNLLANGYNFAVGDIVDIQSDNGVGAKGRVTSIADVTGQVQFNLVDGGYGYTSNSQILISDKVFKITNVATNTAVANNTYFSDEDTITAKQYGIDVINVTNSAAISIGDYFYNYYSNGDVKGVGIIQDFNNTTSNSAGQVYITLVSGNVDCRGASAVNGYLNSTNTVSANLGPLGILDMSASANVLGTDGIVTINYSNSAPFNIGEGVYQTNAVTGDYTAYGTVLSNVSSGSAGTLILGNNSGVFVNTQPFLSTVSNNSANLTNITINVGVINIRGFSREIDNLVLTKDSANISLSNTEQVFPFMFVSGNNVPTGSYIQYIDIGSPNNTIVMSSKATANAVANLVFVSSIGAGQFYSNTDTNQITVKTYEGADYTTGSILSQSQGALASFTVSPTLKNQETLYINTDFLRDYKETFLYANDYHFSLAQANLGNVMAEALNFETAVIGTISKIASVNAGEGYTVSPIVKIYEPYIAPYGVRDVKLNISSATSLFFPGEIITQVNSGARGLVYSGNTTVLNVRPLSFENAFSNSVANTIIFGTGSGSLANVDGVSVVNSLPMGYNAVVTSNVVSSTGVITSMEIVDSGYGFHHREQGTFFSSDATRSGTVEALLGSRTEANTFNRGREGTSTGYYRSQDGFLSASKKVYDAYYYQEYSYEIRSAVTLDKYEAMLKQLLHVSGTKYFANTVTSLQLPVPTTVLPAFDKYNFTVDANTITVDSNAYTSDTTYVQGWV
jgi:hypothetical protein